MAVRIQAFSLTDTGKTRRNNQDACAVFTRGDILCMVVADGVGGNLCGEVASRLVVQTLRKRFETTSMLDPKPFLIQGVREANRELHTYVDSHPECRGMATTLTAALIRYPHLHLLHVGDSRGYLLRNRRLQRLTEDHTWVQRMIREGVLTPDEAQRHPKRHVIVNAMGVAEEQQFDYLQYELKPGDQILLCSDGLYDELDDNTIREVLMAFPPKEAIQQLIDAANAAGGRDNISITLAALEGAVLSDTRHLDGPSGTVDRSGRIFRWVIALCCLGILTAGVWMLSQPSMGRKISGSTASCVDKTSQMERGLLSPQKEKAPSTH